MIRRTTGGRQGITRRELLAGAARGSVLLALGGCVPGLFAPRVLADDGDDVGAGGRLGAGRALVVIELAGGNDGLNTVVPFEQDGYHRARPTLALRRGDCLALADGVGLHPALDRLKRLYDDGLVAVVQGVGYPEPDRSHFRSMEIWHTARPDVPAGRERTGWLGRYVDAMASTASTAVAAAAAAAAAAATASRLPAIAFGREVPGALAAARAVVPAVGDPARFGLSFSGEEGRVLEALLRDTCEASGAPAGAAEAAGASSASTGSARPAAPSAGSGASARPDPLAAVRRATHGALLTSADMHRLAEGYDSATPFPGTGLGRGLRYVAHMLALGFDTRVFYLGMGGFDTHAAQAGRHAALLAELGGALHAFLTELRRQRFEREVLVLVFSEFGRRVAENASAGTDHGTAAPVLLCGTPVRPGLYGSQPPLERLAERGDPAHTVDFREVYATALGYLGARADRILGAPFAPIGCLRA